ncbi:MAG: hypothetical protein ACTHJM_00625 [Marmoricola sp.]
MLALWIGGRSATIESPFDVEETARRLAGHGPLLGFPHFLWFVGTVDETRAGAALVRGKVRATVVWPLWVLFYTAVIASVASSSAAGWLLIFALTFGASIAGFGYILVQEADLLLAAVDAAIS